MATLPISHVKPDYQHLYDELKRKLEQKGTWIDLLPTNVGSTVLDMVAGTSTVNQFYTEMSLREAFLPTAVRDSSIFSGTRWLGIKISRKTPAAATLSITNNYTETKFIPPYSQFQVGSRIFFNRRQLVITPEETLENVNVYEGTVHTKEFDLDTYDNLNLKEFFLGESGFTVSNMDLLVYTENKTSGEIVEWSSTENAIFEHTSQDRVFYENTTSNGDVSLFFGDGEYGAALQYGNLLKIRYVLTGGADQNVGSPGVASYVVQYPDIKGATTSSIVGGANQKSSLYYKLFAPNMFRTKRKVSSPKDYRAALANYPGVADAAIFGQKDIAPNDNSWMNVIRVCLLPENSDTFGGANPNPQTSKWQEILDWLYPRMNAAIQIQTWNPTKIYVRVRLKVAIRPSFDPGEIRILITENILKLFQKKPGILGRRLSLSDLSNAARKVDGVDYIEVTEPIEEIKPNDKLSYVVLDGAPTIDIVYSERTIDGQEGAF